MLAVPFENQTELKEYISSQINPKKKRIVLFIIGADTLYNSNRHLLVYLNSLALQNFSYSIFYFFQNNITYPWIQKQLLPLSSLFQNVSIELLYEHKDQEQFILYAEERSQVTVPDEIKKRIYTACGGRLGLIAEAVRHYAQYKNIGQAFSSPEMRSKLSMMWNEFLPIEQAALTKIVLKETTFTHEESYALAFLEKTKLLIKRDKEYTLSVALLGSYIALEHKKNMHISVSEKGDILVNSLVVNSLFTIKERGLLKLFISKNNSIISRDEIGAVVWKNKEFTDWALDQLIRRLRAKLVSVHILNIEIITVRGQGYQLAEQV